VTEPLDEARLDDIGELERLDASNMLRTIAGSGAQVRESAVLAREAGLGALGEEGRPRAVVVAGMGGSGISGEVLAAVAGRGCPVPVVVHRDYALPGWVGAADVVVAVSCSGRTEETLSAAEQAVGRGSRLLGVGAANSPLEELVGLARGNYVPVPAGRMPRASLWALAVPLLVAGEAMGLLTLPAEALSAAADRLDEIAERCRPGSESFVNPAKQLAFELAGSLPMFWGASPVTGAVASRCAAQLAENAKHPALFGVLPEAGHNQVVAFDGPFGALGGAGSPAQPAAEDIFRDRVDSTSPMRLRLVLLRESEEHPTVGQRADRVRGLAAERGVGVTELQAEGDSPLERLASLVGLVDFASAYLGLLYGLDPTPIAAITDLKRAVPDQGNAR
jgi:glucose/mannose-6-phosphate isomerase